MKFVGAFCLSAMLLGAPQAAYADRSRPMAADYNADKSDRNKPKSTTPATANPDKPGKKAKSQN